jgi:hypothetical protein
MKTVSTRPYVIIGTAHLGLSSHILKVISDFAKHFKAEVIHVGPLCTVEERRMYENRIQRIRTWEKLTDRNIQIEELFQRYQKEASALLGMQRKRVSTLEEAFGKISFVANNEQMIPDENLPILGEQHKLSKYLVLSSIPANGDRITGDPITSKCMLAMREYNASVLMAHPIPSTKMYKKEGVNCAYMFATTGSLIFPEKCKRVSDIYKQILKPACLLVGIDEKTEEFHCQRVRVKFHRDEVHHKQMPHITFDGLLFKYGAKKPIELSSNDKACYITDVHAPHHAENVIDCFHQLIKLHKPELVIDGGDTCDFASVSRHTEFIPGARENLRLKDDLYSMLEILEGYKNASNSVKNIKVLDSNHAEWLSLFVEKNPALKGMLDWKTLSEGFFADFDMILRTGNSAAIWFGDLAIRHGDQENTLMDAHLSYRNYVAGHYHSYQELGDSVRVGCAAKLDPGYLRGNNTAWQWNITTFSKYKGVTDKHPRVVLMNKAGNRSTFMYRGKIYEVLHKGK